MKILHEDDRLKVSFQEGVGDVFLCFTGIGKSLGGVEVQSEEFKKVSEFGSVFYITDKKRSWGNLLDFDFLLEILLPFLSGKRVFAIGNSMGGFVGAVFTSYYPVDVAIFFCSQYSIDDSVVHEFRWRNYIDKIPFIRYKDISSVLNDRTVYYFFHGDHEEEKKHWEKFPDKENVNSYVVSGCGHDVAKRFKESGVLYSVVKFCLDGKSELEGLLTDSPYSMSFIGRNF